MKKVLLFTITLTLTLFFTMTTVTAQTPEDITKATDRQAFKSPLAEAQMLDWLKEQEYKVEKLDTDFYAISWKQRLPDGHIEDVHGTDVCKVLIESVNGGNTAHFTFSLRLNVDTDVVISSEVEWIKQSRLFSERYRYHYHIESLSTSGSPVDTFQVDCLRHWARYAFSEKERVVIQHGPQRYPYKGAPILVEITDPSGLWTSWEKSSRVMSGLKSVVWTKEGVGIIAGESQSGFAFDSIYSPDQPELSELYSEVYPDQPDLELEYEELYVSLPSIIEARVDVERKSSRIKPTVKVDGQVTNYEVNNLLDLFDITVKINGETIDVRSEEKVEELLFQIRPQGKVVGPEAISKELDILKLTRRLKTLTSQSAAEGWLDRSTAKQLKQDLTDIQAALRNDRLIQAREGIQEFHYELMKMQKGIKSGELSHDPPLTQEAATLLGTNAVYLLRKF